MAEVAYIFRAHGPSYREARKLPLNQLRTVHAIEVCRTAGLGGTWTNARSAAT